MNLTIQTKQIGASTVNSVNARELWEALESKREFATWVKARLERAVENMDYVVFDESVKNLSGGRPKKEYIITMDYAKLIAMQENNKKGDEVRLYFLNCEKKLLAQPVLPTNYVEALTALLESEKEKVLLSAQNSRLIHDNKSYTSTEIGKELGFRSATAFNKTLEDMKIQYKVNGTYVLYSKYAELGLDTQAQQVLDNGKVIYHRKWSGVGRSYLLDLFNKGGK